MVGVGTIKTLTSKRNGKKFVVTYLSTCRMGQNYYTIHLLLKFARYSNYRSKAPNSAEPKSVNLDLICNSRSLIYNNYLRITSIPANTMHNYWEDCV